MEGDSKDSVTERIFKTWEMDPKLVPVIPGFFNEVWHTEIQQTSGKEPQFVVRTRPDMVYAARTSYKSLLAIEPQESIWTKIIAERKLSVLTETSK